MNRIRDLLRALGSSPTTIAVTVGVILALVIAYRDVWPWLVLLVLLGAAGVAWRWGLPAGRCGWVPPGS